MSDKSLQPDAQGQGTRFVLDRKAMEQERLARLAAKQQPKRPRSISPPPMQRQEKKLKAAHIDLTDDGPQTAHASTPHTQPSMLQFPRGVVKKTWSFGHGRAHDIKIEEVLERRTLRTAVLSAFQWDAEWLLSKLDFPRTKLVFIMQAKTAEERQARHREVSGTENHLKLVFPSMEGNINCMHSKLMLLFHPHKLRIVVPTANLVPHDWGESGIMENSAFIIDLPRLSGDKQSTGVLGPFGEELLYFIDRQGVSKDVQSGLTNFQWTGTTDLAFVHAVGGPAFGDEMQRTGLPGLSRAISRLGLTTNQELRLDFAASSIGSLNTPYLEHVHAAAQGQFAWPAGTKQTGKPTIDGSTEIRDKMRIYFPTRETVSNSKGGLNCGGTICLQRSYFTSLNFPRAVFRDYKSTRPGLLSHNKTMYARGTQDSTNVAWLYVGSANMSESAWGKFVVDRQRKELKLTCRNWECGVVLPVQRDKSDGDEVAMSVFDKVYPAPFEYPGEEYGDREPWYFRDT